MGSLCNEIVSMRIEWVRVAPKWVPCSLASSLGMWQRSRVFQLIAGFLASKFENYLPEMVSFEVFIGEEVFCTPRSTTLRLITAMNVERVSESHGCTTNGKRESFSLIVPEIMEADYRSGLSSG
ncbi:hypothetical protein FNV43_RR17195 [Rhamnella rubrinervis]|uniref:Uncharacterized protein n=1 Tax=Rhamnella rubrinervis TaxID=2594499 RepID=A0A8K0DX24_9ROSA|nr:hypothetical protein FNV43_RR17195 [Rhamnella rubrinervis]